MGYCDLWLGWSHSFNHDLKRMSTFYTFFTTYVDGGEHLLAQALCGLLSTAFPSFPTYATKKVKKVIFYFACDIFKRPSKVIPQALPRYVPELYCYLSLIDVLKMVQEALINR
jgi:hypothetical protein